MRTALFGTFPFEDYETLNDQGQLNSSANPWAVQYVEDLQAALGAEYRGLLDVDLHEYTGHHIGRNNPNREQ